VAAQNRGQDDNMRLGDGIAELTGTGVSAMTASSEERLVNLTGHEVVIHAAQPTVDAGEGLSAPPALHLPPEGRLPRVDDGRARLDEGWLSSAGVSVRLTRLRRSRRLTDLPEPQAGTRFVVSRLTALAARHRGDLVFPLAEIRDDQGRVIGAQGLGAYRRSLVVVERCRDWRATPPGMGGLAVASGGPPG
jgi:hypothetical protein